MRPTSVALVGPLVGLVILVAPGLAQMRRPQPTVPPTIHRVTAQPDAGVLTITGTGLGPEILVTVDGYSVPQLKGATDTEMEVLAPAAFAATPGSYRLTVTDPVRRVGDDVVVLSALGDAAAQLSGGETASRVPVLLQLVQEQHTTIADLRARLARLESLLR